MRYIEPHAHMVSRVTDDYLKLATAGCQAVCEPAFWAGFDRSSADGFHDYFCQLTEHEPRRAARFGLPHFSWLCINPKESEDLKLAEEVISIIPQFLQRPNVLGIGEIGLNKNSRNELRVLELHVDVAARFNQLILVHTPHLEDKLKGTRLIVDLLKSDGRRTYHPVGAGCWNVGRHDSLPGIQMHTSEGHRHVGSVWQRTVMDELRLRLGGERSAGGSQDGGGDEKAGAQRGGGGSSGLPESASISKPMRQLQAWKSSAAMTNTQCSMFNAQ
jgi:hypothetical protein